MKKRQSKQEVGWRRRTEKEKKEKNADLDLETLT